VGRIALAFASVAILAAAPSPQEPYLHPRLFVLPIGLQGSLNPVQPIGSIGFERDVDATTGAVVYAPQGTSVRLDEPPGTVVGVPGVRLEVAGTTLAYNPLHTGLFAADPAAYAHSTCSPGPHAAVWVVRATPTKNFGTEPTPNVPLALPIYVDAVTPSAADGFSAYAFRMCFTPPDWPAGAVVRRISLNLDRGIVNETPAGSGPQVWRAIFTTAGSAETVESRAILLLPVDLTLRAEQHARQIALTGTLTQGGEPVAGQTVLVVYGSTTAMKRRAIARTNGQGRLTLTFAATATTWLRASASNVPLSYVDQSGCAAPSLASGGCLTATRAGFVITSSRIRVP